MQAKGWDVQVEGDTLLAEVPDEQSDQYLADHDECVRMFGYDKPPIMNQQEAEQFYAELVETSECLRNLGYPTQDPPSEATVVEELMTDGLPQWNPHEQVMDTAGPEELDKIFEECPSPGT